MTGNFGGLRFVRSCNELRLSSSSHGESSLGLYSAEWRRQRKRLVCTR